MSPGDRRQAPPALDRLIGAGLGAAFFLLYAAGASRTIYVGDSGELVTAVHLLGIPHPSGYPLYVMLGKLWTLLVPAGSIAFRMSLFSAACAAAACAGLYLTLLQRPPARDDLYLLGLVAGVATRAAVAALGVADARIKWPNDVVVGERKLAGILLEGDGLGSAAPLVLVGIGLVVQMTTWRKGRQLVAARIRRGERPMQDVVDEAMEAHVARVPGVAVYLFKDEGAAPPALVSNLRHNHVLHDKVLLLSVHTGDVPRVGDDDRAVIKDECRHALRRIDCGIFRCLVLLGCNVDLLGRELQPLLGKENACPARIRRQFAVVEFHGVRHLMSVQRFSRSRGKLAVKANEKFVNHAF